MRECLKRMSQNERHTRSLRICEKLLPHFFGRDNLGLFAPMATEPDLDLLWDLGFVGRPLISYPRCEGKALSFHAISALSELLPGRFGIRQPAPGRRPEEPDLVVVPGLAFTGAGNRLGRGAGYYDRFLSMIPPTTFKIGVCFEFQKVAEIPCQPHDVRMDVVVEG
jgi:5-formyltetrahydrofolate cyclo-ligase